MKKITLLGFLMAMLTFGAISQITDLEKRQMDDFRNPNASTLSYESKKFPTTGEEISKRLCESNFVKMTPIYKTSFSANSNPEKTGDELTSSGKIEDVYSWGIGHFVEDGKPIMFSQKNERSHNYHYTPFFKSATIDFLDDDKNVTKTVVIKVPDTTMSIRVLGQFSKTVFNSDSKFEFMAHAHGFAGQGEGPASCRDTLYVINEDGKILKKFGWVSGGRIVYDAETSPITRKLMVYGVYYSGIQTNQTANIYDARTLALQYEFSTPNNLLTYSEGPVFEYVRIDNIPYFYTANYEKPFVADGNHMEPEVEMNNKYLIKLLDPNTYEVAKEFKLNLIGQEDNKWSRVTHGFFSNNMKYDLSTKIFNSDDKFEILYGMSRYIIDCDCDRIDYYVVDEDNQVLKTLPKEIDYVQKISNILGESEQYALLLAGGTGIKFVNMPSFEDIYTFDAVYEGELLSVNFDRVPTKDSYNWVFQLGKGEDGGNTWYGGVAYYDINGKMVKRDRVDLGPRAASFSPVISQSMVSPYWADTDAGNEYAYFGKFYGENDKVESYFGVSDDDKTTPYKWSHSEYGDMAGAGVTAYDNGMLKELYVSFEPPRAGTALTDYNIVTTVFYKLPLASFSAGGTGTVEDPYVITTPGDLNAVRFNLDAHFVLGNDIDLKDYSTPDGNGWVGIGTGQNMFKGSLDGKNHCIKNLYMDRVDSNDAGLFGCIGGGAVVENLDMIDVNIVNGGTVGAVAADAVQGARIENCHVTGALSGSSRVGGIVGKMTGNTTLIKICDFEGEIVSMGDAAGIVASATTGSRVILSFSKGSINGKGGAGGIIGAAITDVCVKNSYSTATVTSESTVGGIVGDCRSVIVNAYSTGNITSGGGKWSKKAGSIAGSASTGMVGKSSVRNVAGLSAMVTAPELSGRIIGEAEKDDIITNAYALFTMKIGIAGSEATVTSTDATSNNGASKTLDEMNQAFYESMEWKFGNDSINPWKMEGSYPRLWHEFIVRGVSLNEVAMTIDITKTFQLVADIMPATAENKGILWESSDNKIVKVDQKGLITAMGKGTATITITTDDGDYAATCVVIVNVPVTSITLDRTTMELAKGKSAKLMATVNPENANNTKVNWTSSDIAIATVSSAGEVKAVKPGSVVITAITEDGGFTAACNVKVVILTNKIVLNETEWSMLVAETFQLEATVRPTDATNKDVTWTSTNPSVATVSNAGLVTAIAEGSTSITVATVDGGATATCGITVGKSSVSDITNEHIKIFHTNNNVVINSNIEIKHVLIHDINGRLVYNGQQLSIPTTSWSNGVYIVKAVDVNSAVNTSKVIVQ